MICTVQDVEWVGARLGKVRGISSGDDRLPVHIHPLRGHGAVNRRGCSR